MVKTQKVHVKRDHLVRIAKVEYNPIVALSELIWNSLDADAENVEVRFNENSLGGVESIDIFDDGIGIQYDDAAELFGNLGGSWKKRQEKTFEKKRTLHGARGQGRFLAFRFGHDVNWNVVFEVNGSLKSFTISMTKEKLEEFQISELSEAPKGTKRGVRVNISGLESNWVTLRSDESIKELTQQFALYLKEVPSLKITFDGTPIDFKQNVERFENYELEKICFEETQYPLKLELVEWKSQTENVLYLCDDEGFPLGNIPANLKTSEYNFAAYLKSEYFSKVLAETGLELVSFDTLTNSAIESAKCEIKNYFKIRETEKSQGLVDKWKKDDIYPFVEEPANLVEKVERQVFDVVALQVNEHLPDFESSSLENKRLQLRLLRQSIENKPSELTKILFEVLKLPAEKRKELSSILDRTTLSNIISASKIVTDRLEFINGLETIIFEPGLKENLLERQQLHRILAKNSWIFGEQYHLSVDDKSLTQVLKKHIELANLEIEIDAPVTTSGGGRGIIDLMFSRNIQLTGSSQREHLIVELKRPNFVIDSNATAQIKKYASSVANDERFKEVPANWVFWVLSNDVNEDVNLDINQRGRESGLLQDIPSPPVTIWVKTWSQVINDCKARLQFFSEKLNYIPDESKSMEHLKEVYDSYLTGLFADSGVD